MKFDVRPINKRQSLPFIMSIHYAKRKPCIQYAFALFDGFDIIGIVTYGVPSSAPLRCGLAGDIYAGNVLELNRLCLKYNRKNEASYLVSKSLKMLPKDKIIISFADTEQGHVGTVYQACNFTYHGLSEKRTDWKVKGKEHLHGQTIADEFRGVKNRSAAMREKYGDDFYLKDRPRKHRYVYVTHSTKKNKKIMQAAIKYKLQPYPKEGVSND